MRTFKPLPDLEYLKQRLRYDPDSGKFYYKYCAAMPTQWNTRRAGTEAGSLLRQGHVILSVDQEHYYAHRIAWYFMTGEVLTEEIDHKNNIKADNRWCNLRRATSTQNGYNVAAHCKSGVKGAYPIRNKYQSKIRIDGKNVYLGTFDTAEEAGQAFANVARQLHGEFLHASLRD